MSIRDLQIAERMLKRLNKLPENHEYTKENIQWLNDGINAIFKCLKIKESATLEERVEKLAQFLEVQIH